MSFKTIGKKNNIVINQEISKTEPLNFANIIIQFSEFGESKTIPDLYEATEKIPFKERDPLYQEILKNEFVEGLLFEIHKHLFKINYLITKLSD